MIPGFAEFISRFPSTRCVFPKTMENTGKTKRKIMSLEIVEELQLLFGYLWNSNRRYVQSETISKKLADDCGNTMAGDIGEYSKSLLLRINEAFELQESPLIELSGNKESQMLGIPALPPIGTDQVSESFVSNSFFGSFKVFTQAIDKNGTETELVATNTFDRVVIKANKENLYKCWEASYFTNIDNFHTPSVIVMIN